MSSNLWFMPRLTTQRKLIEYVLKWAASNTKSALPPLLTICSNRSIFEKKRGIALKNVKSSIDTQCVPLSHNHKTHRMALISISLALGQTPVYTVRPRIRGYCIARCACSHRSCRWHSFRLYPRGMARLN